MSATSIGAGITGQTYISPPRVPCTGSISELQGIGRATWGRSYFFAINQLGAGEPNGAVGAAGRPKLAPPQPMISPPGLIWHFDRQQPGPPSAISVIGRDDSKTACGRCGEDRRASRNA